MDSFLIAKIAELLEVDSFQLEGFSCVHLLGDTAAEQGPARHGDEGPRNVWRIPGMIGDYSCGVHDGLGTSRLALCVCEEISTWRW